MRKKTIAVVVLALFTLFAASCTKSSTPSSTIAIGAVLPLSGENASFGTTPRNAYMIAEEDAKQQGRMSLKLVYGDSRMDKDLAQKEYRRMVDQDKVVAFVEVAGSGCALALVDTAARDQVPIMSGIDTSPLLTSKGGPFFFRFVPSDAYSSQVLSEWATGTGLKKGVLIYNQQNDWAVGFKNASTEAYRAKSGDLPDDSILTVTDDTVDFTAAIATLKTKKPGVWFVGLMGHQAGLFVNQAVKKGVQGPFVGVDNFAQQEFVEAAGDGRTHARFVLPAEGQSETYRQFVQKYKQRYNREPDSIAFKAYDGYMVVLSAIEGLVKAGTPVTGASVKTALEGIKFDGIAGKVQFDQHHDLLKAEYQRLTYDKAGAKVPAK